VFSDIKALTILTLLAANFHCVCSYTHSKFHFDGSALPSWRKQSKISEMEKPGPMELQRFSMAACE